MKIYWQTYSRCQSKNKGT